MSTGELLSIEPLELKFPCEFLFFCWICFCFLGFDFFPFLICVSSSSFFSLFFSGLWWLVELKKQISCSLQLSNKTDNYVAFKVSFSDLYVKLSFFLIASYIELQCLISLLYDAIWNLVLLLERCRNFLIINY